MLGGSNVIFGLNGLGGVEGAEDLTEERYFPRGSTDAIINITAPRVILVGGVIRQVGVP